MDEVEVWRDIPGTDGMYQVSDTGRVRSFLTFATTRTRAAVPHFKKLQKQWAGYRRVTLWKNGRQAFCSVHRLVLLAFVGPCPDGMEAAHKNGVRSDNRLSNLMYCTHTENQAHQELHGTRCRGERHPSSKLTAEKVRTIRARHLAGEKIKPLAREYKMHDKSMAAVVYRKTWIHV